MNDVFSEKYFYYNSIVLVNENYRKFTILNAYHLFGVKLKLFEVLPLNPTLINKATQQIRQISCTLKTFIY